MKDPIFSVSDLTTAIRERLETAFPFVWVRGQVSNLSRPASGHIYFSLRDEHSTLATVWFKGNQKEGERFDPLTGEVYEEGPRPSLALSLAEGQEIVCAGRIAVYGARGQYQLVLEFAQDAGLGALHQEFERLRAKLSGLGYFVAERKRDLPPSPSRIALLTSPRGAAIHDFLRLAQDRGLGSNIRLHPVPVQGDQAPTIIIRAFERIWAEGWAQVIVLIRGGGSPEDLWAFNNEQLAEAIFNSPVPVLAGIGHEIDVTLADMTADKRAATPSHAAQLLWPERAELGRRLRMLAEALPLSQDRRMAQRQKALEGQIRHLALLSPKRRILERRERLNAALNLLRAAPRLWLNRRENELVLLRNHLRDAARRTQETAEHGLERIQLRLEALDPLAPLGRGYALACKNDGSFVRSKNDVRPGEALRLVVGDGQIPVRVQGDK